MINQQVDHTLIENAGHGTLKSYIVGFILSILLTIIPYEIVVSHVLSIEVVVISVVLLGVLQLLVQLIFFLHLSTAPAQRWNLMTFAFTVLILVILVAGSLWIMWNMNYNMMVHTN
mgnify:CR=1 FL=1